MKNSILIFCLVLLSFACKKETSHNQVVSNDDLSRVSKSFPTFPEGTIFKEVVLNEEKAVKVKLPDGYFFRVDGEVIEGEVNFTCVCQSGASGGCFPILIGNPKKT
jgi:hypothetical protein